MKGRREKSRVIQEGKRHQRKKIKIQNLLKGLLLIDYSMWSWAVVL